MRIISIIVSILFLSSCTPQQRLNNLLGKHPYLAQAQVRDTTLTVFEVDTIYVDGKSIDTVFSFYVDTFVVNDSGVTVTIPRSKRRFSS